MQDAFVASGNGGTGSARCRIRRDTSIGPRWIGTAAGSAGWPGSMPRSFICYPCGMQRPGASDPPPASPAAPPAGYSLRTVSVDDAASLAALINACTRAEIGTPLTSAAEVRDELTTPRHDPATDDALLVADDGEPAGFVQLWADVPPYTELTSLVFTHPEHWGHGVSAYLVRLGEERVRGKLSLAPPGARVVLRVARYANNEAAGRLFEALGYRHARTFWMMRIDLDGPQPDPEIPEGIEVRPFERGRDERAVHAALDEAFRDHWGELFEPFDQWVHHAIEGDGSGFDPGLWWVAVDGGEVVGAVLCRAATSRDPHTASVDDLGVRGPWRRRGIGLALLRTAFAELHHRGIPRAELGVDSDSPTGATRLYERAGMRVDHAWEFWEKELRPGA